MNESQMLHFLFCLCPNEVKMIIEQHINLNQVKRKQSEQHIDTSYCMILKCNV